MEPADNLLAIEGADNAPIPTSVGIAAIALNMALKWHDMRLIKDGALYQQKKLAGENFEFIDLNSVFETAKQIEAHLMHSPDRLSGLVLEVIEDVLAQAGEADESNVEGPQ